LFGNPCPKIKDETHKMPNTVCFDLSDAATMKLFGVFDAKTVNTGVDVPLLKKKLQIKTKPPGHIQDTAKNQEV
jgi:hypothetical protein